MSAHNNDFAAKYTNANLSSDAASYDSELFTQLLQGLRKIDRGQVASIALAVLVCLFIGSSVRH